MENKIIVTDRIIKKVQIYKNDIDYDEWFSSWGIKIPELSLVPIKIYINWLSGQISFCTSLWAFQIALPDKQNCVHFYLLTGHLCKFNDRPQRAMSNFWTTFAIQIF